VREKENRGANSPEEEGSGGRGIYRKVDGED